MIYAHQLLHDCRKRESQRQQRMVAAVLAIELLFTVAFCCLYFLD
jgi:hypothetical protein